MKIVCESCGAKYSIADEKVAGKVFKIRCKRCSEVIMVRGDQPIAEQQDQPEALQTASIEGPVWHVVVNGEQQGPYEPQQLADLLNSRAIDWESFVWREGFDNWVPLRNVDDLVALLSSQQQEETDEDAMQNTTAAGGFAAVNAADAFAGEPSMGADPFAEESSPTPSSIAHQDLFGNSAVGSVPLTGGGALGSSASISAAPVAGADEAAMTGARNENSVLFSLKNLQALATGSGDQGAPDPNDATGFANGEGSGLIDIRALASANQTAAPPKATEDNKDELLSLTSQGGTFGGLGSPMMAPPPDESSGNNRSILYASILGGALLIAAAVVAVGVINRPAAPTANAAVAPVAPAGSLAPLSPPGTANGVALGATATPPPEAQEVQRAAPPSEGELAAAANARAEAEADEADESADRRAARRATRRNRNRSQRDEAPAAESAPSRSSSAPSRDRRRSNDSIEDLLAEAVGKGGGRAQPAAAQPDPTANLPDKPARDEVMEAMNSVRSAVGACSNGESGVAFANVTVAGKTGRVINATIEGPTGSVGSCIARAVRKARFPRFKSETFKVKFPFRL